MSERAEVLVYGAGGHGCVVLDAALRCPDVRVLGFLDDDVGRVGQEVLGVPVVGNTSVLSHPRYRQCAVVVAVGDGLQRKKVVDRLAVGSTPFMPIVHPSAFVGRGAKIGAGSVILPHAVVHTNATVGCHTIVNTGAIIEHDCILDDFVHVAPGAILGGGVHVGSGSLIGLGASIIPGVQIGIGVVVAAGAAVVSDVASGDIVGGVPARSLRRASAVDPCDRAD